MKARGETVVGKLVVLKLGDGSFEQGFSVTLQIGHDGDRPFTEIAGRLPPDPDISHQYSNWQSTYRSLGLLSRIKASPGFVTNISVSDDCDQAARNLRDRLNAWFNADSFRCVREKLLEQLMPVDEIRIIVQTDDIWLRRLPWHLWELCDRYPKAEIALSAPAYERSGQSSPAVAIKILAILGNSEGINTKVDRALLEQLPNAKSKFLVEPQLQEINNHLWQENWDILFFAGHSSSQEDGETGRIYINQTDSLTITELKYALRKAVERGLKLAIFNSCDGLGLARDLADLQIPQVIVMREPVPDRIAQEFFKHFLHAFSGGQSLYRAVREARERLQGLEKEFPCATWLPVICQNPAETPLAWPNFKPDKPLIPVRRHLRRVLLASIVATTLVMGVRYLGMLQTWELQAYDQMLRMRPPESPDPRILVVGADEADINKYGFPLPDAVLAKLLEKLKQYQPIAIGLDIYRDKPVQPGHDALVSHLKNKLLITACKLRNGKAPSVAPPPESPAKQVGFIDLELDKQLDDQDYTVRRYLLSRTPNPISNLSSCNMSYAFSLQLASRFLEAKGIPITVTPENDWKFGSSVFKSLETHAGGYQKLDARGNQVLLNYRSSAEIAQQVTVTDVLNNQIDPTWVKNRVVLVGVTADSVQDDHDTPYGKMRGLTIHAHMVSQILSAALDNRSLISWLPQWGDALWIWTWSLTGGIIAWRWRSPLHLGLAGGIASSVLYGFCFGYMLIQGGWIPLIPSALTLVTAEGIVMVYTAYQIRKQQQLFPSTRVPTIS